MVESHGLVVAVVGAGRVGSTLGRRWTELGHQVRYGVRDPDAERHGHLRGHAEVLSVPGAVAGAEVVLVAVPGGLAVEVAAALGDLGGAVLVDATNPLVRGEQGLALAAPAAGSNAQAIADAVPSARVVKAFNTCGAETMANADAYVPPPTMWLAADDEDALAAVARLATDLGFDPAVAGPLSAAVDLEHLGLLWVRMATVLGHGREFVITRQHPA